MNTTAEKKRQASLVYCEVIGVVEQGKRRYQLGITFPFRTLALGVDFAPDAPLFFDPVVSDRSIREQCGIIRMQPASMGRRDEGGVLLCFSCLSC